MLRTISTGLCNYLFHIFAITSNPDVLLVLCSAEHGGFLDKEIDFLRQYSKEFELNDVPPSVFIVCNKMDHENLRFDRRLTREEAVQILEGQLEAQELRDLLRKKDKAVIRRAKQCIDPDKVRQLQSRLFTQLTEIFPAIFPDRHSAEQCVGKTIHFVSGKQALDAQIEDEDEQVPQEFEAMRNKLVDIMKT